ncbi:MAG: porin, partial [Alphaproteobacteria bacterium]|nr:porin [Alphaproteobacteria bacterium]
MTTAAAGALACAGIMVAGPASAADKLSLGVGGYMEQWVGYTNRDDKGADGGFGVQSDSEIHFRGSLESDSGLKFTVHVELEANNEDKDGSDQTEIDESFVRASGEFGTIEIGQRDPIHARTHYAAAFGAGVGLNAGDTQKWIPGAYLETAGWTIPGDDLGVIYITPRVNGVQVGLSYHPDSTNENAPTRAPMGSDNAVMAAGINFNQTIGDMAVKVSLGHVNVSNPGMAMFDLDMDNDSKNMLHTAALKKKDDLMKGFDDKTYTNAGLSVGMGA